ncbi:uncharacterized protein G2W53_015115 [Senna tora]|uniref:Uncharacterized protein n=1 Tax=Senna tora TaxID=362788 RepID=A0A834WUW2_9FABA|nr:uncharacterized protein G2W53_015115 [Senna tora]
MQKCFGRVKEKNPPPPWKRKCLVWSFSNDDFVKTTVVEWVGIGISKDGINIVFIPNKFNVASRSLAQPLKHSLRRQKLSPSKRDPWPPDRSLGTVISLHQISRRRRLVAADLAGENAEVLRESEGEKASAAAKEEVFGLEVSEGNLLLYSV